MSYKIDVIEQGVRDRPRHRRSLAGRVGNSFEEGPVFGCSVFWADNKRFTLFYWYFEATTNRCVKSFNEPLFKDLFLKLHSKHFPSGAS